MESEGYSSPDVSCDDVCSAFSAGGVALVCADACGHEADGSGVVSWFESEGTGWGMYYSASSEGELFCDSNFLFGTNKAWCCCVHPDSAGLN
ncbi:MAG: hypothetical protein JXX28_01025 [Deltaproteobacteria bacterium]|nr:hypothetical protein [Deltaproteobacteria bacterium]